GRSMSKRSPAQSTASTWLPSATRKTCSTVRMRWWLSRVCRSPSNDLYGWPRCQSEVCSNVSFTSSSSCLSGIVRRGCGWGGIELELARAAMESWVDHELEGEQALDLRLGVS